MKRKRIYYSIHDSVPLHDLKKNNDIYTIDKLTVAHVLLR